MAGLVAIVLVDHLVLMVRGGLEIEKAIVGLLEEVVASLATRVELLLTINLLSGALVEDLHLAVVVVDLVLDLLEVPVSLEWMFFCVQ